MLSLLLAPLALAGTHVDEVGDGGDTITLNGTWAGNFFIPNNDIRLVDFEATFSDDDSGCDGSECAMSFYLLTETSSGSGEYSKTSLGSSYAAYDSGFAYTGPSFSPVTLRGGTRYGLAVYSGWSIETASSADGVPDNPIWGEGLGYDQGSWSSGNLTASISARQGIRMRITVSADDEDGDGYDAAEDCDESSRSVNPGAADAWYDGVDTNCDRADDYDQDGDGASSDAYGGTDCDDTDATIVPGGRDEWYDGEDSDCAGDSDYDRDRDGDDSAEYGGGDCDDNDPAFHSQAEETWYDGVDQDCSGTSDFDQDGDGHDTPSAGGDDCDDTDPRYTTDCTTPDDSGGGGGGGGWEDDSGGGLPDWDDDDDDDDDEGGGCLCAASSAGPVALALPAVVAGLLRRRRRDAPR